MDYNVAKFWLEVLILLSNVILWAWALNNRKHTATNERLETMRTALTERIDDSETAIETRLDAHSVQLKALETHRENAPSVSDIKRLHERIDELSNGIHGLTGEFSGVSKTVGLLHEYLLNHKP